MLPVQETACIAACHRQAKQVCQPGKITPGGHLLDHQACSTSARWSAPRSQCKDSLQPAIFKPSRCASLRNHTCRPSTVSSGLQYQRPLKRTVPSCSRHMRSMRTSESCDAMNCRRGLRGACRDAAGLPVAQSPQCHSPCSRITS